MKVSAQALCLLIAILSLSSLASSSGSSTECDTSDPLIKRYLTQIKKYQKDAAKWDKDFEKYKASLNATDSVGSVAASGQQVYVSVSSLDTVSLATLASSWSGYDIRSGSLLSINAPFNSTTPVTETVDSSKFQMCFTDSQSQMMSAMSASASISGSVFGFSTSVSSSFSTGSSATADTSSFAVYMATRTQITALKHDDIVKNLPLSNAALKAAEEPEEFLKLYGTHFVAAKVYGCNATLVGSYEFTSSSAKTSFSAKVSAGFSSFGFSAEAAASLDKAASSVDSNVRVSVAAYGDLISSISVKTPTELSSWATAFTTDWPEACKTHPTNSIIMFAIQPWSTHRQLRVTNVAPVLASFADTASVGLSDALALRSLLLTRLQAALDDIAGDLAGGKSAATLNTTYACDNVILRTPDQSLVADLQSALTDVQSIESPLDKPGQISVFTFLHNIDRVWKKYNTLLLSATHSWDIEITATVTMYDGSTLAGWPTNEASFSRTTTVSLFDSGYKDGVGVVFAVTNEKGSAGISWMPCGANCNSYGSSSGVHVSTGQADPMMVTVAGSNLFEQSEDTSLPHSETLSNQWMACSVKSRLEGADNLVHGEDYPFICGGHKYYGSDQSWTSLWHTCPYRWLDASTYPVDTSVWIEDFDAVNTGYLSSGVGSINRRGGTLGVSLVPAFCPLPLALNDQDTTSIPAVPVVSFRISVKPRLFGTC